MKKIVIIFGLLLTLNFPISTQAIGWKDLLNAITKIYGVDLDIKNLDVSQLDHLIELQRTLMGKHHYGNTYYERNSYDWGNGTDSWQNLLALYQSGGGEGRLGETILALAREYPINNDFNSPNETEKNFYRLQAQTALASRSAAEVAYQQAVHEENTMRQLHDLIDKVEDEKSASDLNNRFSSEQAMTSLQQLKLLSILVQQQAVNAQEKANRAKEDMEFFDIK